MSFAGANARSSQHMQCKKRRKEEERKKEEEKKKEKNSEGRTMISLTNTKKIDEHTVVLEGNFAKISATSNGLSHVLDVDVHRKRLGLHCFHLFCCSVLLCHKKEHREPKQLWSGWF
jgi:hypothetical protein